jgi:peptide deformylase
MIDGLKRDKLIVRYWDDPVLSTLCDAVEDNEFGPKLDEFGTSLLAAMGDRNGIGLAAPQVGVTKRIFALSFPDDEVRYGAERPAGMLQVDQRRPIIVCNPVLVLDGRTVYAREGCLSLPGIHEQVARAETVKMQFRRTDGAATEIVLANINARVAQHEFDHLNGIMFFNYTDKRPQYGARMSKQVSKQVLRDWEKERSKRGI